MEERYCVICGKSSKADMKICSDCNRNRLAAASAARIFGGTGLTRSNCEAYSEENWIKMNREKK